MIMKRLYIIIVFTAFACTVNAQLPSECTVPAVLRNNYYREVANLGLKWMYCLHSPDTALIDIPQWCQDTVWKGLAAIYNRNDQDGIDSIFNKYCIHGGNISIWRGLSVHVDTAFAWVVNWANLQNTTGIPDLDSLLQKYGFTVTGFYHEYNTEHRVTLHTDQLINEYIFCDSLESFPGIISAKQATLAGQGAMSGIAYYDTGYVKYFTFHLGWGMVNGHSWRFKVYPDCSIEFLGVEKYFYEPYPEPVNCNLTGEPEPIVANKPIVIHPNPVTCKVTVSIPENQFQGFITILNLTGKALLNHYTSEPETHIDISNLQAGIYLARIIFGNRLEIRKIIKL